MANSVFFKTLSKSIYTSNMIKGGGLKQKLLTPKYLWSIIIIYCSEVGFPIVKIFPLFFIFQPMMNKQCNFH